MASGMGQELFNAAILGIAVVMLRVAQPLDVVARRGARRQCARRRQRDPRRPPRMLGAARRRRARGAARGIRDGALPLRHRRVRGRRLAVDAGRRHRRDRRRHRGRLPRLRGTAAHSAALVLHGDGRARALPRRRHGVAGGALPRAGGPPAEPRLAAVGHVGRAAAGVGRRHAAAQPRRLRRASGRHADRLLCQPCWSRSRPAWSWSASPLRQSGTTKGAS